MAQVCLGCRQLRGDSLQWSLEVVGENFPEESDVYSRELLPKWEVAG